MGLHICASLLSKQNAVPPAKIRPHFDVVNLAKASVAANLLQVLLSWAGHNDFVLHQHHHSFTCGKAQQVNGWSFV